MSDFKIERFDFYHKWLGIPEKDQPPHHYRLLAIDVFERDPDVIDNAADQRTAYVRGFSTGKYARFAHRLLNEISGARLCLLDRHRKAAYDDSLREKLARQAKKDAEKSGGDRRRKPAPVSDPRASDTKIASADVAAQDPAPPEAVEYADALPAEAAVGVPDMTLLNAPLRKRWK